MKKLIIVIMLVLTGTARSQGYDTLRVGMREPTFYYWDTNWFDYDAVRLSHISSELMWNSGGFGLSVCQPEYARYCHTDSVLRVIGVAGAFYFAKVTWDDFDTRDPWEYFLSEYFRLYEVDSMTGEMVMLDEAEWTNTQPRYLIDGGYNQSATYKNLYLDKVYEAYFKTPHIVHDSFYVSSTLNNNRRITDGHPFMKVIMVMMKPEISREEFDTLDYGPKPNHFRRKLHSLDGYDDLYLETDTLWHVYHTTSTNPLLPKREFRSYICLFPIIDTGWRYIPDRCEAPTGLSVLCINSEVVMLSWDGAPAHRWQLSVTPEGGTAGAGTVYTTTTDMQAVTGLDTARWYTAWVRSICDNDSISEWSDSVRFYVPSTNTGTIGIEQPIDAFTHVMPNPASGQVTILSSYRMGYIDIYTLTGQKVMSLEANANSMTADLSSLPTGSYIVRIHTSNGVANKRLVVK